MITQKRMEKLAEEHEAKAATLRAAIDLLNGDARPGKIKRMASVVGAAIQARAARNGNGAGPVPKKYASAVVHQREDTARALAVVAAGGAMTSEEIVSKTGVKPGWIGPMRSRGYLKAGPNDTYLRTKKTFEVQPGRS